MTEAKVFWKEHIYFLTQWYYKWIRFNQLTDRRHYIELSLRVLHATLYLEMPNTCSELFFKFGPYLKNLSYFLDTRKCTGQPVAQTNSAILNMPPFGDINMHKYMKLNTDTLGTPFSSNNDIKMKAESFIPDSVLCPWNIIHTFHQTFFI